MSETSEELARRLLVESEAVLTTPSVLDAAIQQFVKMHDCDPPCEECADCGFLLAQMPHHVLEQTRQIEREVRKRLSDAIKDVFWRATQYGQTDDGDTYAYLVTKGAMHRLIGAAQSAGIPAAFRVDQTPLPDATPAAHVPGGTGPGPGEGGSA